MTTTIFVLKYGGEFYVRPGAPVLKAGTQVRFVNQTADYVVVSIPHREFEFASLRVDSQCASEDLTLPQVPKTVGRSFPYSVYAQEGGTFCKGGSIPIIIVEP